MINVPGWFAYTMTVLTCISSWIAFRRLNGKYPRQETFTLLQDQIIAVINLAVCIAWFMFINKGFL